MTLVDEVAAAIVRNDRNYFAWHFPGDEPRQWESPGGALLRTTELCYATVENKRKQALGAIAAMREPTVDMTLHGARSIGSTMGTPNHVERARDCYQAMIDAVLKEEPREK